MGTRSLDREPGRHTRGDRAAEPDWPEPATLALGLAAFILAVCVAVATLAATGLS